MVEKDEEGEGEEGEGGEWRGGREWNRKARGLGSWGGSCKKVNSLLQNVSLLCVEKRRFFATQNVIV